MVQLYVIFIIFVDYEEAYHSLIREKLLKILRKFLKNIELVQKLKNIHKLK
jgi:hypothetical protein